MAAQRALTLIAAVGLMSISIVFCRNFDARFAVIKRGHDDSYFGFSVAQHQFMDENDVKQNILFIGAPKEGRQLFSKRIGGSLYSCEVTTPADNDCSLITTADSATSYRSTEDPRDQWLGVTVASAGFNKKAVACAHRYIRDNAATGFCTVLEPDLQFLTMEFMSCRKRSYKNFMQDFGLCQQGMSAAVGEGDALLMGAPGSVFWQGTVFAVNITDEPVPTTEKSSPYDAKADPARQKQATPTKAYSYNGYAVAVGKFDATNELYYVSGAPKSKNTGEVVFFTSPPGSSSLKYEERHIIQGNLEFSGYGSSLLAIDLNNDGFDDLIVGAPYYYKRYHGGAIYVYLGGPKMITSDSPFTELLSREMGEEECKQLKCEHARFGTSLTAVGDINEDDFQDFAVGAPYEGNGAVYIYYGSDAKEGFNTKYVQRITAKDLPVSNIRSFGYSLSGGMDLDESGYPDLLVGAYESDAVALIRTRPIVKLMARIVVPPTAVDLESKDPCTLTQVPLDLRDKLCVPITLCLSYKSKITVIPKVLYTLVAEPQRRFARLEILNASDKHKKVKSNTITLDPDGEVCETEVALMKSQTQFEDKLNPMDFQYTFSLESDSSSPAAYPASAIQDINNFPFLDTNGSDPTIVNTRTAQVEFVMECGDDNKCTSDLQLTSELANLTRNEGMYELVISNENILYVSMSLWNEDEPAYLTKVYIQTPQNVSYMGTDTDDQVTCQRSLEDGPIISCDRIGNPLRQGKRINFVVRLDVPKDFAANPDLTHNITVKVNTSSTDRSPLDDEHVLYFRVINKAEITLETNVAPDSAILCKGEPRGASAIADESDIGAAVTHNFIVNNRGPGVVSESYISIKWPYEVASNDDNPGKRLLYLMRMPKIEGNVIKCNDDDIREFVNPLKIKEVITPEAATGASSDPGYVIDGGNTGLDLTGADVDSINSRQRREAEAIRSKRASGRVVTMSCQDDTARCFEYKCKLGKLESKNDFVKISMEARLWESTLLSDYRKKGEVEIMSWGHLIVPEKLKIVQDPSNDRRRAITRAIPDLQESAGGKIQWWIILVAVLVGLLVLLVLIFILYKVGFFRRRRMEDMQMYKAEKKQQAMLQEYNDDGF